MSQQTVMLDVREDIIAGGEPCSRIMELAARLQEGDTLCLLAPFEPVPLYQVLGRQGFTHESRALEGGDWEVRFTRNSDGARSVKEPASGGGEQGDLRCNGAVNEVIEIDVRGLEPPQPLVRILDAVAAMPKGADLRARTDRQPVLLFEQLEARGFHGEGREDSDGGYVTFIRRL